MKILTIPTRSTGHPTKAGIPAHIQTRAEVILKEIAARPNQNKDGNVYAATGRDWRIILHDSSEGLAFDPLLSHEKYNHTKPQGKRA